MATSDKGNKQGGDTSKRGFASMDPEQQREIAAEGGRAAHEKGTAHEFTSEEARRAGSMSHKNDPGRSSQSAATAGSSRSGTSGGSKGGANQEQDKDKDETNNDADNDAERGNRNQGSRNKP